MRLKLIVIALYAVVILVFVPCAARSYASSDSTDSVQARGDGPELGLDVRGRRGLVIFHHSSHENLDQVSGFKPPYRNMLSGNMTCVVCHHRQGPRETVEPYKPGSINV